MVQQQQSQLQLQAQQQYAIPGYPGVFECPSTLTQEYLQDSQNHGFDDKFVQGLCTLCSTHPAVLLRPDADSFINFEVGPRTTVNEAKLHALARYVGALSHKYVQVHILQSQAVAYRQLKVTLISCPQGAMFGTVLLSQTFQIKNASRVRSSLKSLPTTFCSGVYSACVNVARRDPKVLCAVLGTSALLVASIYPVLRTAAAVVGAVCAGVSIAARKGQLDRVLQPFNDGVNIGTAIPSGQQLSEMFARGSQNFTFLLVSVWHFVSLLIGRVLVNLDQWHLDRQTFVGDAKPAEEDMYSVPVAGLE